MVKTHTKNTMVPNNMYEITIRKVKPEERDTVFHLLRESAEWLLEKNINYWEVYITLPPYLLNWINTGFDNNEFCFAENTDNEIIGCFRLQDEDPMFWGDRPGNAGYVHSFAVSRKLAGRKIGHTILTEIESYCRQNGKQMLRLDCSNRQPRLRQSYKAFGFSFV